MVHKFYEKKPKPCHKTPKIDKFIPGNELQPNVNASTTQLKYTISISQSHKIYLIFNESGLTTVQTSTKIVATKGMKRVFSKLSFGSITTYTQYTILFQRRLELSHQLKEENLLPSAQQYKCNWKFIAATVFVSSQKIQGSLHKNGSGWMQFEEFLTYIQHFAKHVRPTAENPLLLLLDNHSSHICLPVIERPKVLFYYHSRLTAPTNFNRQIAPFLAHSKKYYSNACENWMRSNPGKRINIYDIPEIVGKSLPNAIKPSNIEAGFKSTGIWPFNRDIFTEADFLPSSVTDIELVPNPAHVDGETMYSIYRKHFYKI